MSFIGIIANQKNEEYIRKKLSAYFPMNNIIFITEKNISNIKNVKFETILIDKAIKSNHDLKNIISNCKYIILNTDLKNIDLSILEDLRLNIITYGFNNKATFTISSITENKIIICLQRIIKNIFDDIYEPQEYEVEKYETVDITIIMGIFCTMVIYGKK